MRDRRKVHPSSAKLFTNGYLRLSSDLVPPDAKKRDLKFIITPLPQERQLVLRVVNNGTESFRAKRKLLYSNEDSKCPMVTVKSALKFMGIRLPKKSIEFPVKKEKNILTVQF